MKTIQAFQFELDPTEEQITLLRKHAGTRRFIYNWGLAKWIELWKQEEVTSWQDLAAEVVKMKKTTHPWLSEISSIVPTQALQDLEFAYKQFFRRCKKRKAGEAVGYPKFKKKWDRDRFRLTGLYPTHIKTKKVRLPKIEWINVKEETTKLQQVISKFDGYISSATVTRKAHKWYVSFQVERTRKDPQVSEALPRAGVDMGVTTIATVVDSAGAMSKVHWSQDQQNKIEKIEKAILRNTRRLHKKRGASNRRDKQRVRLAKLHLKLSNITKDFCHKFSTGLAKTKSVITVEDLKIGEWKKQAGISRKVRIVGYYRIREMLEYKTIWYGSKLVVANRYFPSSKRCNKCGYINKDLKWADREWSCASCGSNHDREINAGKNLLEYVPATSDRSSESNVRGEDSCCPSDRGSGLDETKTKTGLRPLDKSSMKGREKV